MRIEPPASITVDHTMSQDCTLSDGKNEYQFKKGQPYEVNIAEIHHDPEQWIEPTRFVPDRFDFSD